MNHPGVRVVAAIALAVVALAALGRGESMAAVTPVGSAFTYQGLLKQAGEPASGVFDFQFRLFETPTGGTAIGTLVADDLAVSEGMLTIDLDFGANLFDGNERWLEIAVNGQTLSPRQPIMPAPYALFALSGNEGPAGPQGDAGPMGQQGPQGEIGPQGPIGLTGAAGSQGPQGDVGPQGPIGLTGATGAQGPQGEIGPQGPIGLTGATGAHGAPGIPGLDGESFLWTGQWDSEADYAMNDVVGWQGRSYIAVAANTGEEPTLAPLEEGPSSWELMVDKGAAPFDLVGLDAVFIEGNVGLGTSSPTSRLEIVGDQTTLGSVPALKVTGNTAITGALAATSFAGDGSGLTNIDAASLVGSIPSSTVAGTLDNALNLSNAANTITGSFTGTGTGLTGLDASSISQGMIANARTTGTAASTADSLVMRDASGNFAANSISAASVSGSGAGLTGLNAANVASGNLAADRLPTGGAWSLSSNLSLDSNTMVIDQANNRLGIGTAVPSVALDVSGGLRVSGGEGAYVGDGSTARTWVGAASNVNFIQSGNATWNASRLLHFTGFNGNAGTFAFNGNIGIGTTSPVQAFDIVGAGGPAAASGNGANGMIRVKPSNSNLVLDIGATGGSAHAWLQCRDTNNYALDYSLALNPNGGNVGIGTSAPSNRLSVLGTADFSRVGVGGSPIAKVHINPGASGGTALSFSPLTIESAMFNRVELLAPDTTFSGVFFKTSSSGDNTGMVYNLNGDDGLTFQTNNQDRMRISATGHVQITGTLSKGGGSFRIDHPLDPENKELWHSFVESPDMMNIYNGNVRTDGAGYAVVEMPEWFEALNRDFRYQLTVIDEPDSDRFILTKVVKKIVNNQFTIRTSMPFTEVSWQVTGVRHDPFAQANRIPTEVDKRPEDKGTLLHPQAYAEVRAERNVQQLLATQTGANHQ